jgi:hypothetical protein
MSGVVERNRLAALGFALASALPFITTAKADRIDGEWCREGYHFVIEGPRILTYGGTATTGEYSRHGFRYTAPATDPDSGAEIEMYLHSETTLELFRRVPGVPPVPGPGQIWNRCRVTS